MGIDKMGNEIEMNIKAGKLQHFQLYSVKNTRYLYKHILYKNIEDEI